MISKIDIGIYKILLLDGTMKLNKIKAIFIYEFIREKWFIYTLESLIIFKVHNHHNLQLYSSYFSHLDKFGLFLTKIFKVILGTTLWGSKYSRVWGSLWPCCLKKCIKNYFSYECPLGVIIGSRYIYWVILYIYILNRIDSILRGLFNTLLLIIKDIL